MNYKGAKRTQNAEKEICAEPVPMQRQQSRFPYILHVLFKQGVVLWRSGIISNLSSSNRSKAVNLQTEDLESLYAYSHRDNTVSFFLLPTIEKIFSVK